MVLFGSSVSFVILLLLVIPFVSINTNHKNGVSLLFVVSSSSSVECELDGTCSSSSKSNTNDPIQPPPSHQQHQKQHSNDEHGEIECGLYMAESSIPNAGYGVYTGQYIPNHTPLHIYDDVVIQYVDINTQRNLQNEFYRSSSSISSSNSKSSHTNHNNNHHVELPKLLLREYFWKSTETQSTFDAYRIDSISPGFGMLANCALGLVNHIQSSCRRHHHHHHHHHTTTTTTTMTRSSRFYPTAGASSTYQDCYFTTIKNIPIGHEMYDNYGDNWFLTRSKKFGTDTIIPLTDDYNKADHIVQLWQQQQQQLQLQQPSEPINDPNVTSDLYDIVIMKGITPHLPKGTQQALPNTSNDANKINYTSTTTDNTVAYQGLKNHTAIRSIGWLREHGMCLDHIEVQPISILRYNINIKNDDNNKNNHYHHEERGAFARRMLPKGIAVAPAPLIHLSRRHTDMIYADTTGGIPKTIMWQGHQLLLNYCYGHPSSSLLLFPYSHGVNLINHPTADQKPNVGLRWSKRMKHPEWLQFNVSHLLEQHNDHSGLMMEFYALHDIEKGEEILYEYGTGWQKAWDRHVELWNRTLDDRDAAVVHYGNYISAFDYEQQCNHNISQSVQRNHTDASNLIGDGVYDCLMNVPSWIDVRCWIADYDKLKTTTETNTVDGAQWYNWMPPEDAEYNISIEEYSYYGMIDETFPCEVQSRRPSNNSSSALSMDHFNIRIVYGESISFDDGYNITNVPRSAIIMVDRPYTGNQFLRPAFRHEIQLPDDMMPAIWKDLQPSTDSQCGLYMAESAIPFSGLGMYTGVEIVKGSKLFSGDVVVQAEDIDLNVKLRHWAGRDYDYKEKEWLLNNYYWSPETSVGIYEAKSVESIIPGFGMLANSHTGLVNANIRAPTRYFNLQRGHDPGAGSSTTFHDVYFDAKSDIEAGAELFVQYGDAWFAEREDLGFIPLSTDFKAADRSVKFLLQSIKNLTDTLIVNQTEEFVADFFDLSRQVAATRPRLANAFPKDYNSFEVAVQSGTATLTVPNRVRTIEWLEENGRCLDNIRPELSTIRQAGRGAFATRRMKMGDVITPMPLVHVLRRHMEIYDGDDYDDKDGKFWIDGQQLLLNYCYGHPESSLLLFPYAPVSNYINHNASQSNAELRWSTLPNHHADWLERSPDSLDLETHSGLIMELVATKDIARDEEIFLNYGPRWETSWNEFLNNRKLNDYDRHFTSSEALNDRIEWLKTVDELEDEPYEFSNNEDVKTICFVVKEKKNLLAGSTENSMQTYRWSGAERLINTDYSYPCDVVERNLKGYDYEGAYDRHDSVYPVPITYTVILTDEDIKVVDVPRKAIQFFDYEYISDNSWRKAFRHEIHLPDHMLPPTWRDLKPLA